jgi:hypothetical protein
MPVLAEVGAAVGPGESVEADVDATDAGAPGSARAALGALISACSPAKVVVRAMPVECCTGRA